MDGRAVVIETGSNNAKRSCCLKWGWEFYSAFHDYTGNYSGCWRRRGEWITLTLSTVRNGQQGKFHWTRTYYKTFWVIQSIQRADIIVKRWTDWVTITLYGPISKDKCFAKWERKFKSNYWVIE